MLPLAVAIALGFLWLFLWSVRNGDYDDAEMTAHRILFDEKDDVDSEIRSPHASAPHTLPSGTTPMPAREQPKPVVETIPK